MLLRIFHLLSRRIDGPLMVAIFIIMAIGLTVVFSATGGVNFDRTLTQLRNFCIALILLWVCANVPPQRLMQVAVPIYILGILLLVATYLGGDVKKGAKRWLNVGVTTIQPSEILKIATPLMLAWYFHTRERALAWRDYLIAGLILGLPFLLVAKQPDLGTALLIGGAGFGSSSWQACHGRR